MTDPYKDLARAVVEQAAKDYRSAVKKLKKRPDDRCARKTAREVEGFFRSDWFSALSGLDGEYIIQRLKEERA